MVLPPKDKDGVFDKFKEETLTERKLKTLRSNNGGKYTSKELIAYCKEADIKRELIIPNKMDWLKGRIGQLKKKFKLCCLIKIYQSSYGKKQR